MIIYDNVSNVFFVFDEFLQKHSTEIESVVDELTELKSGSYHGSPFCKK